MLSALEEKRVGEGGWQGGQHHWENEEWAVHTLGTSRKTAQGSVGADLLCVRICKRSIDV